MWFSHFYFISAALCIILLHLDVNLTLFFPKSFHVFILSASAIILSIISLTPSLMCSELKTSSQEENHTVNIKCFCSPQLGFTHTLVTDANYEITSKAAWKMWLHKSVVMTSSKCIFVLVSLLFPFPCVCFFPSSSKESSTTVWVSMWRTSLTNQTVWLPTIDGFTTNITLTTLDRYKR